MLQIVLTTVLFISSSDVLLAQGTISGNVIDAETGEDLIGVNIVLEGSSTGTVTDISGNYQLSLDPGAYTLNISYVSYAPKKIEGVEVKEGEVNRIDITMETEETQLQEVVVQASQINNNEVAMLKLQQKALAVQDGISIGEIRRIGATNSAESMKQVTGASVEGGKYVVMRGLGDRYSLTQMNGVTLPSTNPYRNSVSMDLIPTTIIDNIVTTKTFTPDQPGNFTGGNVNISTRSIPDDFYISANVSVGYNTQASLKDSFLTDPVNSERDWIGYGQEARSLPEFYENEENRDALSSNSIYQLARRQSEEYEDQRRLIDEGSKAFAGRSFIPGVKNSSLNNRFQLSFGDRKQLFNKNLGYNMGLTYGRSFTNYSDRQLNIWELRGDFASDDLQTFLNTEGQESVENVNIGVFGSLGYQFNNTNELTLNYTYSNDVEESAAYLNGVWPGAIAIAHTYEARSISYLQRRLSNIQLSGKHRFGPKNNVNMDWVLGYTLSSQLEPDTRVMANNITSSGLYEIRQAEYDRPFHFFRDLEDNQYNAKIDFEVPLKENNENRLKFGFLGNRKERDFTEQRYQHQEPAGTGFLRLRNFESDEDYDEYFGIGNLGVLGQNENGTYNIGTYYANQTVPSNSYIGSEQVLAGYAMGIFQITDKLKAVGGLRTEKTDFRVESQNPTDAVGVIDELDFLPSLNLIYAVNDKSNIRLSGSRTLARPNMRELAPFFSFDFIGGFINSGNPDLERSRIWNGDLRYEFFPNAGELIAVSAFYKYFDDPIQRRLFPVGSGGQITYVNVDKGVLYGLELEYRKGLGVIADALNDFKFSANFTYILSRVDLTEEELGYFKLADPDAEDYRPFQSQSPYIINTNLTYFNPELGLEATVYANMYGKRLFYNGFRGIPDVYEVLGEGDIPTPDLRFTIRKTIWENFNVGLRGENLLDAVTYRFVDFKGTRFINESFRTGRTFTISFGYTID